jgi:hypothetical protein
MFESKVMKEELVNTSLFSFYLIKTKESEICVDPHSTF